MFLFPAMSFSPSVLYSNLSSASPYPSPSQSVLLCVSISVSSPYLPLCVSFTPFISLLSHSFAFSLSFSPIKCIQASLGG